MHSLADLALQPQSNFLGGLGFLMKDGLGLPTIAGLFPIITPLACSTVSLFRSDDSQSEHPAHDISGVKQVMRSFRKPTLRVQAGLSGLVLRDLVHSMLFAVLVLAEGPLGLRDVHLCK